ncbi:MAG: hypothetical protein M3Y56_04115 [Armatimonadota bacterium]|nr:hypothetical protein [Armatimonadota bacterium]
MNVQEIEQAITQLPSSQVAELSVWLEEFQAQAWDKQIEEDARAGRFNKLIEQAKVEYAAGRCKPL